VPNLATNATSGGGGGGGGGDVAAEDPNMELLTVGGSPASTSDQQVLLYPKVISESLVAELFARSAASAAAMPDNWGEEFLTYNGVGIGGFYTRGRYNQSQVAHGMLGPGIAGNTTSRVIVPVNSFWHMQLYAAAIDEEAIGVWVHVQCLGYRAASGGFGFVGSAVQGPASPAFDLAVTPIQNEEDADLRNVGWQVTNPQPGSICWISRLSMSVPWTPTTIEIEPVS
jgi:hypothetical protein